MDATTRLGLPLLIAGQAQKEIYHNEALQRIDACVAPCVVAPASASVPAGPAVGDCFLVGSGAAGAWAGQDQALAMFSAGGWRFVAAREGLRVWVTSTSSDAVFRSGEWDYGSVRGARLIIGGTTVVGTQQGAIGAPAGGTVIDSQGRTAIGQILVALRAHGLIAP